MPMIDSKAGLVTIINTYHVEPERCDALLRRLVDATQQVMRHQPGFVSASFHRNWRSTRVANYAQWKTRAAFAEARELPEAIRHRELIMEIAESAEPIVYAVVFTTDDEPG